jgi:CheY-like chemotaxis protein
VTGLRVLVVDDEPDLLCVLATLLEDEGYEVVTAASGDEAVARARREHFHLMVTDLKMPGMDGLEVVAAIGAIDPDVRPILMTGFVSDEIRSTLDARGVPYVLKPFEIEEIVTAMHEARP